MALLAGAASVMNRFAAADEVQVGQPPPSAEESAARSELRGALLEIIAAVATVGNPSEGSLQATATAVAELVAKPEELTGPAQTRALEVLSNVASKGSIVSPSTAGSIASALSNVVKAAKNLAALSIGRRRSLLAGQPSAGSAGNSSNSTEDSAQENDGVDPRLKQVMGIVGQLASSLTQAITVPGEEAIFVTSSALQARGG